MWILAQNVSGLYYRLSHISVAIISGVYCTSNNRAIRLLQPLLTGPKVVVLSGVNVYFQRSAIEDVSKKQSVLLTGYSKVASNFDRPKPATNPGSPSKTPVLAVHFWAVKPASKSKRYI